MRDNRGGMTTGRMNRPPFPINHQDSTRHGGTVTPAADPSVPGDHRTGIGLVAVAAYPVAAQLRMRLHTGCRRRGPSASDSDRRDGQPMGSSPVGDVFSPKGGV